MISLTSAPRAALLSFSGCTLFPLLNPRHAGVNHRGTGGMAGDERIDYKPLRNQPASPPLISA